MRLKHRNVSMDSPFDPRNKPPEQYIKPENILDKPCKLDLSKMDVSKVPLAGKLGILGQKILDDKKKARQFTEYDWESDCLMTEQEPRAILGKISPQPVAQKLNHINMTGTNFAHGNFSLLHKSAQYPNASNIVSRN